MKFSVLIPVYAKEKASYFDQSLKSIVQQTLLPDEIVIVEDGSLGRELDEVIVKYVKLYKELFKIVRLKTQSGLGKALNAGLMECSYDIVARMDSDDICLTCRFEKQISLFENNEDIHAVGAWTGEFDGDPCRIESVKALPEKYDEILRYAKSRNPLNHMTVMFRKSSVIQSGNYLPSEGNEDYYLWVRMLLKKYRLVNIPEILVLARADSGMFRRRGGIRYVKSQIRLEKEFLSLGFINKQEYIKNILVRVCVGLFPAVIRQKFYKKFLREDNNIINKIHVEYSEDKYNIKYK